MTATLRHTCDVCGNFVERDVTADAAAQAKVFAGYPGMWWVGNTHDACPKLECQGKVRSEDEPDASLPDEEEA